MDEYDYLLLEIIGKYDNTGQYPRIGIPTLDRIFWSRLPDEMFFEVPLGEKIKKLKQEGFIDPGNEDGLRAGFFITSKGKIQLKKR